jgi:hypothetical protein
MWPYNEDEAGWLKPRERAEPVHRAPAPHASANDNDPARRAAPPSMPTPTLPPKAEGTEVWTLGLTR